LGVSLNSADISTGRMLIVSLRPAFGNPAGGPAMPYEERAEVAARVRRVME